MNLPKQPRDQRKKGYEASCNLVIEEKYRIKTIESMIAGRILIGDKTSDIYLYLQSQLNTAKNNLIMLKDMQESLENSGDLISNDD